MSEKFEPVSEWQRGPHFEEWFQEDRARQINEASGKNQKLFEQRVDLIRAMLRDESVLSVRMIRLQDLSQNIGSEEFDTTLEPYAQGEFFRSQLYSFIISELWVVDRAFRLEHPVLTNTTRRSTTTSRKGLPTRGRSGRTNRPPPLVFGTIWIQGDKDPGLLKLNEALRRLGLIDAEGRWIGILEYLGALLRELCEKAYIPTKAKARNRIKDQLKVIQKNGSFALVRESQLNDAFKRAGYGIPEEIQRIVGLLAQG